MISLIINKIDTQLTETFVQVDNWFDEDTVLLNYSPLNGGWSTRKVLEHISLTNYFLLVLIHKATRKAMELSKKQDYSALLLNYDLDWQKLNEVGTYGAFEWNRPAHMEPGGTADLTGIRNKIKEQVEECRACLRQLKNGEGVIYKTMMSVNSLGRIDVYHYIYFLVQHAERHLTQVRKIKNEFQNK